MCHAAVRRDGYVVAGLDSFVFSEANGVLLDNLFGKGLWNLRGGLEGGEKGIRAGIFELCMEDILKLSRSGRKRSRNVQGVGDAGFAK